jgi:hypothetical protein
MCANGYQWTEWTQLTEWTRWTQSVQRPLSPLRPLSPPRPLSLRLPSRHKQLAVHTANRSPVSLESIGFWNLCEVIDPDAEVLDQAILQSVDPPMDGHGLSAEPCILDNRGAAECFNLFYHIQFAQLVRSGFLVRDRIEMLMVPDV